MAFIATSLDKELQSDTTEEKFVVSVTRHFAILHGVRAMEIVMKSLKPPSRNNAVHIDGAFNIIITTFECITSILLHRRRSSQFSQKRPLISKGY